MENIIFKYRSEWMRFYALPCQILVLVRCGLEYCIEIGGGRVDRLIRVARGHMEHQQTHTMLPGAIQGYIAGHS